MLPKADGQRAWQRALHSAEASELLAFLSLSACAVRAAILAKAASICTAGRIRRMMKENGLAWPKL
jgi:hypothetical protein